MRGGADGVHLGEDETPSRDARSVVGPEAVVGRSAGSVGTVLQAVREAADYPGVGAVFAAPTKPDGEVAGLALIRALARENFPVP